jgi:hypothetical protein
MVTDVCDDTKVSTGRGDTKVNKWGRNINMSMEDSHLIAKILQL